MVLFFLKEKTLYTFRSLYFHVLSDEAFQTINLVYWRKKMASVRPVYQTLSCISRAVLRRYLSQGNGKVVEVLLCLLTEDGVFFTFLFWSYCCSKSPSVPGEESLSYKKFRTLFFGSLRVANMWSQRLSPTFYQFPLQSSFYCCWVIP